MSKGHNIYGMSFVFPGDLVTFTEGLDHHSEVSSSTHKGRYVGTSPVGNAWIRVTGSRRLLVGSLRHLPWQSVKPRATLPTQATFPTGPYPKVPCHYGQLVSWRGGWYRVVGSGEGYGNVRIHTPYGPRIGLSVHPTDLGYPTQVHVENSIRATTDQSYNHSELCGRCGCATARWDLVNVRGDREERICPFCIAIHEWDGWTWNGGWRLTSE